MKNLKQIISLILLTAFVISAVFNVLFLFGVIKHELLYIEFAILIIIIFIISALGIVVKNIRKDEFVTINIITPAKEIGPLYAWTLIFWVVTYFLTMIFK